VKYDEIRSILGTELSKARTAHEREGVNRHSTGDALKRAGERYERFTLHGMIPDNFKEDGEGSWSWPGATPTKQ
jgi:hypothetical protein